LDLRADHEAPPGEESTTDIFSRPAGELRGHLLLGRYLISERIAVGGMAEVYLATHGQLEGFQTPVVIKRVLPKLADSPEFIAMFLDEARIAALLQHPNIATILEVGRENNQYFLAMELVQGEPLSKILRTLSGKRLKFPPPLAAYIASQVAAGLHHAHTSCDPLGQPLDVVHRDVSPQNILITYEGTVKVIDFGIARAMGRVTHTGSGNPKGKLSYMSPEQARGEKVGPRSDVFSLGVVLWEMITGVRLFRGEDDTSALHAILNETPAPLQTFTAVSPFLQTIVAQALAKNPDQRFSTALAIETLLQRYIAEEQQVAGTPELRRFMRVHFAKHQTAWRQRIRRALAQPTPLPDSLPILELRSPPPLLGEVTPYMPPRRPFRVLPLVSAVVAAMAIISFLFAWQDRRGSNAVVDPVPAEIRAVKVVPLPASPPEPVPVDEAPVAETPPPPVKDHTNRHKKSKKHKHKLAKKATSAKRQPERGPSSAKRNPFQR